MSDEDVSPVDRWLGTPDPSPLNPGLPSQTKFALAHPVLVGIISGSFFFLLGWVQSWWRSVNIAVALFVGLVQWFLWTAHGGPLRKRFGPPPDPDRETTRNE